MGGGGESGGEVARDRKALREEEGQVEKGGGAPNSPFSLSSVSGLWKG